MTAQTLNPLTLPLQGASLIEASAGTGKTYTLAALYLRLLLGLGQQAAYPRPLSVEEILVVTFTEAATDELRGRIRENIHRLRLACVRGPSMSGQGKDGLFGELLSQIADADHAARLLLAAERQMDEAAIYTIHGFCQRMLGQNTVESGMLFQQTLVEDESALRRQVCADFWRRHCYPLPYAIARVINQEWDGPEKLLAELLPYMQGEAPVVRNPPDKTESIPQRHERIIARTDALKRQWRQVAGLLPDLVGGSGVDKRSYSSKNLPLWLDKIAAWAAAPTDDYAVPKELERFRQSALRAKTTKGAPPEHALFDEIDRFFEQALTLRELIFVLALDEMRLALQQEKRRRGEMGFDDLLSRFDEALRGEGGDALALSVRRRYPVAMIDEFQDTDPQQYRIFRRIYGGQPTCGLVLIGDPKQAIYAFRGADIFTYMRARSEVSAHYTLDTNWRSSPAMIGAVNQLFQSLPQPFIFQQIPFLPVGAAAGNGGLSLMVDRQVQPALRFWLQSGDGAGVSEYQHLMARQCAAAISDLLAAGRDGRAWFNGRTGREVLQASDMTVLVRNRNEASLVRDALSALSIPAVYLSNRDSVYETPEARELLWLLQAILIPGQDSALRCALATSLMGLDARDIEAFNHDGQAWDTLVDEFAGYRLLWRQRGVLPMLRQVMVRHQMAENLLASANGERRLTDLLHLAELLQEASAQLENEHALVRWLALQIELPNTQADNQQLRLESDRHLVQITTVHKSKGLEFPVVFLPFVADFRQQKRPLYHDRDDFQAWLDLSASDESLELAEEERLAEDLRLLYVALTRSIYQCCIGIAPLFRGGRAKSGDTDVHQSALGYLIQRGRPGDAAQLRSRLEQLSGADIALDPIGQPQGRPWQPAAEGQHALAARRRPQRTQDHWRLTSYSGLQQHGGGQGLTELLPRLDVDAVGERRQIAEPELSPHAFARGASPGTFLHSLFESLDFTQPLDRQWLSGQLAQNGIDDIWQPVIGQWLERVLNAPLDASGVRLSDLEPGRKQAELQFYLPIDATVTAGALDALCKQFDPLSARCPPLDFPQVRGMLKGFIDLVFCWQDRYYLLDYKSNWLGEDNAAYTPEAMARAMAEHRYDLQYQLYTLALHRYLRHRLADYDYQRHFGGVFYLFLRGVAADNPGNGIFSCRPDSGLIDGLDALFSRGAMANTEDKAV
ncbi:exodeoxyribonuclease V subunit beta [Acerihabitans arboris]|uniref:RecBCD enzyme subunit RecB n=1 Tax=Acerihabitans arboris TaxID=2691583 RepID=A0A845SS74_9GAMM|nr:exodeoxyribonuclease V subunit beta [Acerihabitans arboris]NDL65528.1 exodeoxyribonuclease V subunit beta [Acerihabitans arboris]